MQNPTEIKDCCRHDTRYFTSSARLGAKQVASAVRGHWMIENALHWTLDVVSTTTNRGSKEAMAHTTWLVRHFRPQSGPSPAPNPSSADEKSPDGAGLLQHISGRS
ncbi:transposase (fragment) [Mesorhizobium plurifarium]|uniref:Transposase n=1 Tax=Mesorhizobium plurifarium TaxID=69974 RepID=A0A090FZT0_MESPL